MEKLDNKEQYKLIFEVVAFCLSLLALVCVVCLAILALFFPIPYAYVLKSIGLNNIALSVYQDVYFNSNKITDGYSFLNEAIIDKNDKYIIVAYEACEKDDEFLDFLSYINNQNYENYGKSIELIGILNERDYVKGKYVHAVFNEKGYEQSYEIALKDFNSVSSAFDSVDDEKTFVLNDYLCSMSTYEQAMIVSADTQEKMKLLSEEYGRYINQYLSMSEPTTLDYVYALECSVRYVEFYNGFKKIYELCGNCILDEKEISDGVKQGNVLVSSVLKTAV